MQGPSVASSKKNPVYTEFDLAEAALKIQRSYRRYQEQYKYAPVNIMAAEEVGWGLGKVIRHILKIHREELAIEGGLMTVKDWLRKKYLQTPSSNESKTPLEKVFVAKKMERIVGYAMMGNYFWDPSPRTLSRVFYLAVEQKGQSKNIGTRLMLYLMNWAKNEGCSHVCVEYLLRGREIDPSISKRKENFYEVRFSRKFGIVHGTEERNSFDGNFEHRYIQYNLATFDENKVAPFL
jgi:GNAT superfamily N-acetyltransferase